MIYIYNPKLSRNAWYLGDLCQPFELLSLFVMRFGWLCMRLSDNGALSESEWASIAHTAGSVLLSPSASEYSKRGSQAACAVQNQGFQTFFTEPLWCCMLEAYLCTMQYTILLSCKHATRVCVFQEDTTCRL